MANIYLSFEKLLPTNNILSSRRVQMKHLNSTPIMWVFKSFRIRIRRKNKTRLQKARVLSNSSAFLKLTNGAGGEKSAREWPNEKRNRRLF